MIDTKKEQERDELLLECGQTHCGEQNGNQRAEYGTAMMDALAAELTKEYGKGKGNGQEKQNLTCMEPQNVVK